MPRRPVLVPSLLATLAACGTPPASSPSVAVRASAAHLPLANLDTVAAFPTLPTGGASRHLTVVGQHVVLESYPNWVRPLNAPMEAWSFDVTTGARVATFAPVGPLNMEWTREGPEVFLHPAGDLMIGMNAAGIFAVDPATGRRLWQTVLYDATTLARMQPNPWPFNRVWPAAVKAANGVIYALVEEAHSRGSTELGLDEGIELFALDASRGTIRWRAPLAGFDVLHEPAMGLFVTATAVVVRRGRELHGFADGRRLWTAEGGDVVLGDRSTLVVVDQGAFFAVDPRTGKAGPKHADGVGYQAAAGLEGGVIYGWARNDGVTKLVATRAGDGQRLWQSPPVRDPMPNLLPPVALDDGVYACLGGSMRAFDRTSGATAYVNNVGGCFIIGIADATPAHDAAVVASIGGAGTLTTFARVPAPTRERNVRVSGTVRLECIPQPNTRVWIDDLPTTTDRAGRFEMTISTRGLVRIETAAKGEMIADDGRRFPSGSGSIRDVPPDAGGRANMDFDLHMRTNCDGDYTPLPCKPTRSACPR